jgi:molybdate transport system substrate-binding protein
VSRQAFFGPLFPLLVAVFANSAAAQIRVVSAMPLSPGLEQLADQYKRETGKVVQVQAVTTADINRILSANEPFDVLVTTTALVEQAGKDGKATVATKTSVGRVGIGVIVRSGGQRTPGINTPDALKQAVLSADAVVYNTAGSGQAVQKMFDDMGISAQIQGKVARPSNATQTMERILQGKGNEIGFGLISEIKPYEQKGIRFMGPLPSAVQSYITYEAIVSAGSKSVDEAKSFIRYVTTAAAKKVLAATGVE